MRLVKQNIERDGSGTVTLFPEDPEDMVITTTLTARSYANCFDIVVHIQLNSTQRPFKGVGSPSCHN